MKIVTFLRKNDYTPKRVVDFLLEKDTFRKQLMEIVKDFVEQIYNNNGKPCVETNTSEIFKDSAFFSFSFFFLIFHFPMFSL